MLLLSAVVSLLHYHASTTNAEPVVPGSASTGGGSGGGGGARRVYSYDCAVHDTCTPLAAPPPRFAFVTLISGAESSGYVNGALALAHSLVASGSRVRRLCMVTVDVPEDSRLRLNEGGFEVVTVDSVSCNASSTISAVRKTSKYNDYCTKIRAWTLTDFDKLVFLDADALVLRNVDHLFLLDSDLAMAPDSGCPEHANTGQFVLRPSLDTFQTLLEVNAGGNSFDGTDQGLINSYCAFIGAPWYFSGRGDATCTRLPTGYNLNLDYTVDYVNLQFGTRPTAQPMGHARVMQFAGESVSQSCASRKSSAAVACAHHQTVRAVAVVIDRPREGPREGTGATLAAL